VYECNNAVELGGGHSTQGEQADPDGAESNIADTSSAANLVYQVPEIGCQPRVLTQGSPDLVKDEIIVEELLYVGAESSTRHGRIRRKTVAIYQARAFTRVHQLLRKHTIFPWGYNLASCGHRVHTNVHPRLPIAKQLKLNVDML
jgi:hypothetical protein